MSSMRHPFIVPLLGAEVVSDSHYQSTLDAVYVCIVPWSDFPFVPSNPHNPHQLPDVAELDIAAISSEDGTPSIWFRHLIDISDLGRLRIRFELQGLKYQGVCRKSFRWKQILLRVAVISQEERRCSNLGPTQIRISPTLL